MPGVTWPNQRFLPFAAALGLAALCSTAACTSFFLNPEQLNAVPEEPVLGLSPRYLTPGDRLEIELVDTVFVAPVFRGERFEVGGLFAELLPYTGVLLSPEEDLTVSGQLRRARLLRVPGIREALERGQLLEVVQLGERISIDLSEPESFRVVARVGSGMAMRNTPTRQEFEVITQQNDFVAPYIDCDPAGDREVLAWFAATLFNPSCRLP